MKKLWLGLPKSLKGKKRQKALKISKLLFNQKITVPIYFTIQDDGKALIDFDSITEEFETKLEKITRNI